MFVECIMIKFDGFYLLELAYLANYAKISHFQLFYIHLMQEMAQNHILPTPDLFHPSEKAEICRITFFYHQDDILKFWHWHYFFKIKGTRQPGLCISPIIIKIYPQSVTCDLITQHRSFYHVFRAHYTFIRQRKY